MWRPESPWIRQVLTEYKDSGEGEGLVVLGGGGEGVQGAEAHRGKVPDGGG